MTAAREDRSDRAQPVDVGALKALLDRARQAEERGDEEWMGLRLEAAEAVFNAAPALLDGYERAQAMDVIHPRGQLSAAERRVVEAAEALRKFIHMYEGAYGAEIDVSGDTAREFADAVDALRAARLEAKEGK